MNIFINFIKIFLIEKKIKYRVETLKKIKILLLLALDLSVWL